jgi:hypothetical protein
VPTLITALRTVAERIDRLWASDGDQLAAEVALRSLDPQDERMIRERRRARLGFAQAVLEVDEVEVMVGPARFDLLAMGRPATQRQLGKLAERQD